LVSHWVAECRKITDCADDVATFDKQPEDFTDALKAMEKESGKFHLHISWAETKIQNLASGPSTNGITFNGHTVEGVTFLWEKIYIK